MAWIFVNQQKFYLHDSETLLQGLIRQGFEPAFQCGEGYCGTCKLRHQPLKQFSQIHYAHEPIFMLEAGELLPCSCHVKGVLHLEMSQSPATLLNTDSPMSTCLDPDDLYEDKIFNS